MWYEGFFFCSFSLIIEFFNFLISFPLIVKIQGLAVQSRLGQAQGWSWLDNFPSVPYWTTACNGKAIPLYYHEKHEQNVGQSFKMIFVALMLGSSISCLSQFFAAKWACPYIIICQWCHDLLNQNSGSMWCLVFNCSLNPSLWKVIWIA